MFKPVASMGVLRTALIEEMGLKGVPVEQATDDEVIAFARIHGFEKCENPECDLWYNARKAWFVTVGEPDESGATLSLCRHCAVQIGLEPEF